MSDHVAPPASANTTETLAWSGPFVSCADTPIATVGEGITRQVLGHVPDLMVVRVDFAKGATGTLHQHPHRQVSYVNAGRFLVTIGADERTLSAGDCFVAIADVPHNVLALDAGTLIDVFTPARADFLRDSI